MQTIRITVALKVLSYYFYMKCKLFIRKFQTRFSRKVYVVGYTYNIYYTNIIGTLMLHTLEMYTWWQNVNIIMR